MQFRISINVDNGAFEDNPEGEIEKILERAIDRLYDLAWPGDEVGEGISLLDSNGNRVGFMRYEA